MYVLFLNEKFGGNISSKSEHICLDADGFSNAN